MATWAVTMSIARGVVETAASDTAEAQTELTNEIGSLLPTGWGVVSVELTPTYAVGDWVLVRTGGGEGREYGRVVEDAGSLRVQIGNGNLRPMGAVVRRL